MDSRRTLSALTCIVERSQDRINRIGMSEEKGELQRGLCELDSLVDDIGWLRVYALRLRAKYRAAARKAAASD